MKDHWVIQEIGREIFRNSQNQTKMKAPLISIFEIELWQFSEESYRSEYLHKCGSRYMTKWLIWRAQKQTREAKPQSSEEQEIIKIWAEINDVGTQRTVHKISQTKSCLSGKINKVAKSIAKLTKKKNCKRILKLMTLEMKNWMLQQNPVKSRGSLRNTLNIWISKNQKI